MKDENYCVIVVTHDPGIAAQADVVYKIAGRKAGSRMLKSLKQLLRTPVKAVLFFLLMAAATALLVLGANLWAQTQAQMDAVEKQFTTLGTVEQKPNRTQMRTGGMPPMGRIIAKPNPCMIGDLCRRSGL